MIPLYRTGCRPVYLLILLIAIAGVPSLFAQSKMKSYHNTREATPSWLIDQYAEFSFNYPEGWELIPGSSTQSGNFVAVANTIRYGTHPNFDVEGMFVAPLHTLMSDQQLMWKALKNLSEMYEKQIIPVFTSYQKVSERKTTISGVDAYELRYQGTLKQSGLENVTFFGRAIFVPRTTTNDGMIIVLTTCSVAEGINGAVDVGEKGGLGEIMKSFTIPRRKPGDRPYQLGTQPPLVKGDSGMRVYTNSRDGLHALIAGDFVDFSFHYPASWESMPRSENPAQFVNIVRRAVVRDSPAAVTDNISVAPFRGTMRDRAEIDTTLAELAKYVEQMLGPVVTNFRVVSKGETRLAGNVAYEVRIEAVGAKLETRGDRLYGRFIILPPAARRGGLLLMLIASSTSPGVKGPADVGEKGELAAVISSLKVSDTVSAPPTPPSGQLPQGRSVSRGPQTYVNSRERAPEKLREYYADFTFQYPGSWRLLSREEDPDNFAQIVRAVRLGDSAETPVEFFSVGSFWFYDYDESMAAERFAHLADTLEQRYRSEMATYERVSRGVIPFRGKKAYELRFNATLNDPDARNLILYERIVMIPPVTGNNGVMILMISTSRAPGIRGAEDVGEKGDLGEIFRSFQLTSP